MRRHCGGRIVITLTTQCVEGHSFNETKDVVGGYYHILAEDLPEAIAIAKEILNLNTIPILELRSGQ